MNKNEFRQRLDFATKQVFELTRQFCINELVDNYRFILVPSARTYDEHLTSREQDVLAIWNKYENTLLTADEIVDMLVRDSKVPLWINITISESREEVTIIELLCSRRLRNDEELHHNQETPPFHILSPPMPPEMVFNNSDWKYDLNWKLLKQKN